LNPHPPGGVHPAAFFLLGPPSPPRGGGGGYPDRPNSSQPVFEKFGAGPPSRVLKRTSAPNPLSLPPPCRCTLARSELDAVDHFALMIAALVHHVAHPGTNSRSQPFPPHTQAPKATPGDLGSFFSVTLGVPLACPDRSTIGPCLRSRYPPSPPCPGWRVQDCSYLAGEL